MHFSHSLIVNLEFCVVVVVIVRLRETKECLAFSVDIELVKLICGKSKFSVEVKQAEAIDSR